MKILNREQFLKLPKGVLYAKYEPHVFEELAIKDESAGSNDWYYQDLIELDVLDYNEMSDILNASEEKGVSVPMDFNCLNRDGLYEDDQLFAVYEKEDVIALVNRLNKTISSYPKI